MAEEESMETPKEQEYGVRNPRKLLDPKLPSQKDVDEREAGGHATYRTCGKACVEVRGVG